MVRHVQTQWEVIHVYVLMVGQVQIVVKTLMIVLMQRVLMAPRVLMVLVAFIVVVHLEKQVLSKICCADFKLSIIINLHF